MSHPAQVEFVQSVKDRFPYFFTAKNVLEIGSLNINGSVRWFFNDCEYIGIDLGEGPGVDIVCDGADFNGPDGSFDVVISTECLEHSERWHEIFINMCRLAGGLVVMTCAGEGRPEHGTTRTDILTSPLTVALGLEWYENRVPLDFSDLPLGDWFSEWEFTENRETADLYFYGVHR